MKPIQDMLDAKLPPGTPQDQVVSFLRAQGYSLIAPEKRGTIIAIIRPAGAPQNPSVAGRVTFFFDANGKLNTFSIQRDSGSPGPSSP